MTIASFHFRWCKWAQLSGKIGPTSLNSASCSWSVHTGHTTQNVRPAMSPTLWSFEMSTVICRPVLPPTSIRSDFSGLAAWPRVVLIPKHVCYEVPESCAWERAGQYVEPYVQHLAYRDDGMNSMQDPEIRNRRPWIQQTLKTRHLTWGARRLIHS